MANTWDRTYNPSGAISRTLQGGGSSYSGIPANPTGYPSQNYADFGSAGLFSNTTGDPGFSQTYAGMGGGVQNFIDDSQVRSMNVQQPDMGANSLNIRQWGTQNPNMPGSMALDPTWAGGLRGSGMGAETTMGDVIVEGTRPTGIQEWIDEGLIDSGTWKSEAQTSPIVQATPQGPEAEPSCPNNYTYDPALNACVASMYSNDMSGLDPEQKMNLLSNPKMMEMYQANKQAMTSGEFGARPSPIMSQGGLLPSQTVSEPGIRGDR